MGSVMVWPKVFSISGVHCSMFDQKIVRISIGKCLIFFNKNIWQPGRLRNSVKLDLLSSSKLNSWRRWWGWGRWLSRFQFDEESIDSHLSKRPTTLLSKLSNFLSVNSDGFRRLHAEHQIVQNGLVLLGRSEEGWPAFGSVLERVWRRGGWRITGRLWNGCKMKWKTMFIQLLNGITLG